MFRSFFGLGAVWLTGCVSKGTADARLVDGLTGQPRAEVPVLLEAIATDDLTCKVFDGKTDADGRVHIEGTCPNTAYRLKVKDDNLVVVGDSTVEGGVVDGPLLELKTWRAPKSPGVYLLDNDTASNVRTRTKIMRDEKIAGTDIVAPYPESVFKNPTAVEPGRYLVLVGEATIEKTQIVPVIREPEKRTFASGASLTGHAFLGIRFTSDTEYETVSAVIDESKLIVAGEGERAVRYLSTDALPPGQYALFKDGDWDAMIVGFGPAAAAPAPEAAPPAED